MKNIVKIDNFRMCDSLTNQERKTLTILSPRILKDN